MEGYGGYKGRSCVGEAKPPHQKKNKKTVTVDEEGAFLEGSTIKFHGPNNMKAFKLFLSM